MKLPEKDSLVNQTVRVLQEMISCGKIKSTIPGERTLADQLQVGRDTLRSALTELTQLGWISESSQGKRRQILKTSAPAPTKRKKTKHVIFLSAKKVAELPSDMLLEINHLRSLLSKRSITVEILSPSVFETQNPDKRLQQIVSDYPADAWILYRCTAPVQQWFEKNKANAIVRGYPHPNISLPYLDEDWHAAAFHATQHLISKGHQSIAMLRPTADLEGLNVTERGIRDSIERNNKDTALIVLREKGDLSSVSQAIHSALNKDPVPTAILVTRPRHVINIITWLAAYSIKVPEHISLIALCAESWFDDIYPGVTHYKCSMESMAKSMTKKIRMMLQNESLSTDSPFVIPEYVDRQSVKTAES